MRAQATQPKNAARQLPLACLALAALPLGAQATSGYFSDGYGAKSEAVAGVGIAFAQDALAGAANPAATILVGTRVDLGLDWFVPSRSADIVDPTGAVTTYSGDGKKNFFIPSFGYSTQLSSTLGAGVAVYGNGGLNTQYQTNPFGRYGATGTAGVNLEQLFVTPTLAWKPASGQSLGVGLNLAYQRFSAQGVGFFGGFSSAPANVSDKGTQNSFGAGLRLGWIGTLAPGLTGGLTWASKVRGSFGSYSGLFANAGRFDVPDNYGLGLAFAPTAQWTLAADIQRINYSHVAAVGDPLAPLLQGVPLGANYGPGFGWKNINVYKIGATYQADPALVLRAGYGRADQPVPASETFFNILAPGVVENHFTLGATWSPTPTGELSGFLAYSPTTTVNGSGSIPPGFGGGEANVRLRETVIGISYGWKL